MANLFLRLKCYKCGAIMRTVARQSGKRSRCPSCSAPLRIPPVGVFKQFNGRKVQAIKESEWDFKFVNKGKPAAAKAGTPTNREDFIGVAKADETAAPVVLDRKPAAMADDDADEMFEAVKPKHAADASENQLFVAADGLPDMRDGAAAAAVGADEDPEAFAAVFGTSSTDEPTAPPPPPITAPSAAALASAAATPAPSVSADIDSFFDALGDDGDPTENRVTEVSEFELEPLVLESPQDDDDDDAEVIDLRHSDIDLELEPGTQDQLQQLLADMDDDALELE